MNIENKYKEKTPKTKNGVAVLIITLLAMIGSISMIIFVVANQLSELIIISTIIISIIIFITSFICLCGLRALNPNEALVLTLFGNYYGTLRKEGFYFVNPFCSAVNPTSGLGLATTPTEKTKTGSNQNNVAKFTKKVSLKTMTLNNEKQKVNDQLGNPIIIGVVAIWKIVDPTKAVFNVENYENFLSIQCDSTLRNIARLYPYDVSEEGDEKSLRGSSLEIAENLKVELQEKVHIAGIEVEEVRITHLSYAPEIAAAMLQRQQAEAIIAARKKIVEGAVSMVEMALNNLDQNNVVKFDEQRKAAMVSNLLVVLCGNKDAQPVLNSGSDY